MKDKKLIEMEAQRNKYLKRIEKLQNHMRSGKIAFIILLLSFAMGLGTTTIIHRFISEAILNTYFLLRMTPFYACLIAPLTYIFVSHGLLHRYNKKVKQLDLDLQNLSNGDLQKMVDFINSSDLQCDKVTENLAQEMNNHNTDNSPTVETPNNKKQSHLHKVSPSQQNVSTNSNTKDNLL